MYLKQMKVCQWMEFLKSIKHKLKASFVCKNSRVEKKNQQIKIWSMSLLLTSTTCRKALFWLKTLKTVQGPSNTLTVYTDKHTLHCTVVVSPHPSFSDSAMWLRSHQFCLPCSRWGCSVAAARNKCESARRADGDWRVLDSSCRVKNIYISSRRADNAAVDAQKPRNQSWCFRAVVAGAVLM